MTALPHLFQPGRLGRYSARNLVKYGACCVSNYNTRDGYITPRELAQKIQHLLTGEKLNRLDIEKGCDLAAQRQCYGVVVQPHSWRHLPCHPETGRPTPGI